ncbi:bifunctional (p)ppGpp synthetase/guanosine-3',5'-bis(diphosphate) 3'-pyrophosphohydrolase [Desulfocurvibacter africanus]|uniref:(P)ppGpp synthetase I, SpoT/RelA n=1 Tax=Desulfocurvibacter africanus subsp. africanus str. Walvis Bay TaxID=690850 RepID=F3YYL7_DESAF|nr:bifunctional (p)ppGpp synthetase/guanosine-3',5'-bis(diphosphate) 3'-pyrophosphohydrolase [Desulfocurvibacter africanus]EGJ50771.1 (p)ppGpp synthetase I, SpoT/RelA [Desulfocurvibacter africanus subsp. africanus str. Walvis Bay]
MIRIHEIIDKVLSYHPEPNVALIQKAYVFAAAAHAGQTRLSGEPYMSHPLEVANILADMRLDEFAIVSALLHDTVEDTKATVDEIESKFGKEVAHIVDGVTKISKMTFETKAQAQAENIRKMIVAMAEDIRVIMIKLADRLHNMRTLDFQKSEKQKRIAQETLDIYAPLANRLGLHFIKTELEDLCFMYTRPDAYGQLKKGVEHYQDIGHEYIAKVIDLLNDMLGRNKIKGRVLGRTKHLYSIHNKMLQQSLTLDQVYDLMAFRVIVSTIRDCYAVLGEVHSIWKPVPGRFKDYISMPKPNMYQSLHTTVIGPDGERIEIQIRTEEMHRLAEYGVAAHWQYKEGGGGKPRDVERFSWLREILDWQKETRDPREFMRSLRVDLSEDQVYVFTPRGDVKSLPEGATPVDFAYMVHSEVGDHCAGAKVNGRLVPLSTKLKNGDTVEVITDAQRHPSRDWLKYVKSGKAIQRIKYFIRTEERQRSIILAKEILEKEGRKLGVNFSKAMQEGKFEPLAAEFSFNSAEELLVSVGYGRITPRKVLHRLMPARPEDDKVQAAQVEVQAEETPRPKSTDKVRIRGVDDMLVRYAGCCDPLPGEPIVGYITRGRGVTVHTADCPNVQALEPERLLDIYWEGEENVPHPAKISIRARNVKGALAQISEVLAAEGVNIDSGSFLSSEDGVSELVFKVEVKNSAHLYATLDKLNKLPMVIDAGRIALA